MEKNSQNSDQSFQHKKNVVVVVPEFPKLTQTFIERDLANLANYSDINLTIFSLKKDKGYLSPNLENLVVYSSISFSDVIKALFTVILAKPIDSLKILFLAFGKDSYDTTNFVKRLFLLLKGFAYSLKLKQFAPHHLHLHFFSDVSTIFMGSALSLNVPFSFNVHAKDVLVNPSMPITKIKLCSFVSACNKHAFNKLLQISQNTNFSDKIHLIYHGLDEKRLDVENLYLVKPNRPLIFMLVSRFVEKKGVMYMIQASKLLINRGIEHEIVIIGANDPSISENIYEKYKNYINEINMSDVIKIIGEGNGVPFEEAKQYYKIADIFVLPSISAESGDADGVPNTVIEASLSKLPVVATDAGSIKDLLNEQNSILVEQKNAEQLADAIEKLIKNPQLRTELGKKAYFEAKEMFSSAKNVNSLYQLLVQ